MSSTVQVSVDTDQSVSGPVDDNFFGANILFERDDLSGTYGSKVTDFGLNLLRFPGGGMTEDEFGVANPDAFGVPSMAGYETFSDFMTFCIANGITPAIVIPTKRYDGDMLTGIAEVSAFVAAVTGGVYGPVTDVIFEVGNEYYASSANHPAFTADQYAEIASQFAPVIEAAAVTPVTVAVQMGRNNADNDTILSYFDTAVEIDAVSGLIFHQYPWALDPVERRIEKVEARLDKWEDIGVDALSFMSEWNIGSSPDEETADQHDYGLAQNPALLELTYRSIAAGVDYAAIWGVQQTTKTALSRLEGDSLIYAAGITYQLMSEVIPGKTALDMGIPLSADAPVVTYAYEDESEIAIFAAARDFDDVAGPMTVEIDLTGYDQFFTSAAAVKVTTTDPLDQPKPVPTVLSYTPVVINEEGNQIIRLTFDQDYETIRVILNKPAALVTDVTQIGASSEDALFGGSGDDMIKGHRGADFLVSYDGDDTLRGGGNADQIVAGDGNDMLYGMSGRDYLLGNAGDDWISGGAGRDIIRGGEGNDIITGGVGRDLIFGDAGADRIEGGRGNDRLIGGGDSDTFVFSDNFGTDRIRDLEGIDFIDLSGHSAVAGFADIQAEAVQVGRHVEIDIGSDLLILRFFDLADVEADMFLF